VFALLLSLHVTFANPHTFQKNTKLLNTCSKIAPFHNNRFALTHDQDAVSQQIYDGTPVSDIYSDQLNAQLFLQPQFIPYRKHGLSE